MKFAAEVPEIKDFVPDTPIGGKVALEGLVRQTPAGWQVDAKAQAPEDVSATLKGLLTPLDIDFEAKIPRVQAYAPQVAGALTASGNLKQSAGAVVIDVQADGPYAAKFAVQGALTPMIDVSFDAALPEVKPRGATGARSTECQRAAAPDRQGLLYRYLCHWPLRRAGHG